MSYTSIPGRCAYLWIYDEWIKSAPKDAIAVEVGVALGRSIAHLARLCIDAGRDDIKIYAVDAWAHVARNGEQQAMGAAAGGDFNLFCQQMLQHAPAELQRINVIRTWSTDAARLFDENSVSLVVLDADHTYEWVSAEIRAWRPKLTAEGVMGGDDYHDAEYPGVVQAVQEVYGDWPGNLEVRREQNWPTWCAWKGRWGNYVPTEEEKRARKAIKEMHYEERERRAARGDFPGEPTQEEVDRAQEELRRVLEKYGKGDT